MILALLHLSDIHFATGGNSKILVEELKLRRTPIGAPFIDQCLVL